MPSIASIGVISPFPNLYNTFAFSIIIAPANPNDAAEVFLAIGNMPFRVATTSAPVVAALAPESAPVTNAVSITLSDLISLPLKKSSIT